ncbi:MAG TPA: FtsH protease activity modulator HflK [Lentisphaeria bacterium]|nr:MAG: HflK protein [Lentisphaerae bacterium GWF2_49_21]HBC86443.1 FtsH protease activity modulator HflK [Lentisphaeria bacterium]
MNEQPGNPLDDITEAFRHLHLGIVLPSVLLGILCIYGMTGFYIVKPGEQGVVRRFGQVIRTTEPGAHYRLPRPIESVEVVTVGEVRRAEIGMLLPEHRHASFMPEKIQLLTGDENLINVEAVVQYKVKDAARYLYSVNFSEERLLHNAVVAALVELIGQVGVDDILTTEKVAAQGKILWKAQKVLDLYDSGLQITGFNIKGIVPPTEVADAFRDVITARVDKEQSINQAKGYSNSVIPEARGKARERVSEAEGYRTEVVNRAKGDAMRFESMLTEYQKDVKIYSEDVTRYRLYLETMETVLPRVSKYVLGEETKGKSKVNLKFFNRQ